MASKSLAPRRKAGEGTAVIATPISQNEKIGAVSQTTVSLASCLKSCPLFDNGCYAQQGPLGWMVRRMGAYVQESGLDTLEIAQQEARAIDGLNTNLPLRLHVAGDCSTDETARVVSQSAERYMRRNRNIAWTYTHAWRNVSRESWGRVSVLASCETAADAQVASEAGYASALVVSEYPNGRKSWKLETGQTAIPCPQTTGAALNCASCRLCWDDSKLRARNAVIAFEAHGAQNGKVKATLAMLNNR